jgi:prolyl-tRNA synthetase
VRGVKTDSEKFAGALQSTCIEAMMQDGKALQAGTSHDLGQNFGRAFNVMFQTQAGGRDYVWQTSWGVSTRLIGGLIMTHSDDAGLVLPPRLAPIHVVIVPIFRSDEERSNVLAAAEKLRNQLADIDMSTPRSRYRDFIEVVVDDRDMKPGAKFYDWERKGVPVRVELGPKDLAKDQVCVKMRVDTDAGRGKEFIPSAEFVATIRERLEKFQAALLAAARQRIADRSVHLDTWEQFLKAFAGDQSTFAWCHWDGTKETEAKIKEQTRATIRCIPLAGQGPAPEPGKCIVTGQPSKQRVLIAKAY